MPYIKTTWTTDYGEGINASNLNKIEQGIWDAVTHAESTHAPTDADNTASNETSHVDVLVDGDIGINIQAYSTVLAATTASFLIADESKLDGVEDSANNYSHPTGDGSLHVPANGITNDTKVLTASAVAGVYTWEVAASGGGIGEFIDDSIAISIDDTALANDDGTGNSNIALGKQAGNSSTTGNQNVLIGPYVAQKLETGAGNVYLGYYTGWGTTIGGYNVGIGYNCMSNLTTGIDNIAIGRTALNGDSTNKLTGTFNIGVGRDTGKVLSTGGYNLFMGYLAGSSTTTGNNNICLGENAGSAVTSSSFNIAIGLDAISDTTCTGSYNNAIGYQALHSNTSGYGNVGLGRDAGYNNETGAKNVFIGYQAGYNELSGSKLHIANGSTESLIEGDFSAKTLDLNGSVAIKEFLTLTPTATAPTVNNSFYVDSADGILKFKDNTGTVKIVTLT